MKSRSRSLPLLPALVLLGFKETAGFLPTIKHAQSWRYSGDITKAGLHMASDEVEWYGGDGTNDLKRLRVECFNDKDGGATLDPWQLSDFLLLESGAYSSFIEDADAGSEAESPIFGEPGEPLPNVKMWSRSTVAADYPMTHPVEEVVDLIQQVFELEEPPIYSVEVIRDRDWVTEVQEGWKPIPIGDHLVIRFPWHTDQDVEDVGAGGRKTLLLEGGAAFGSGEHATTVMCCQWLEAYLAKHKGEVNLLDYGSGSGILGLASLLFGARGRVEGVEIDPMAIDSAYRNAAMNTLSMPFYVPVDRDDGGLSWALIPKEGEPPSSQHVDLRQAPYDVVVANILARPLVELVSTLTQLTRPGGHIVLAGLLNEQADAVLAAYRNEGFDIVKENSIGDWALLVGTRRP